MQPQFLLLVCDQSQDLRNTVKAQKIRTIYLSLGIYSIAFITKKQIR